LARFFKRTLHLFPYHGKLGQPILLLLGYLYIVSYIVMKAPKASASDDKTSSAKIVSFCCYNTAEAEQSHDVDYFRFVPLLPQCGCQDTPDERKWIGRGEGATAKPTEEREAQIAWFCHLRCSSLQLALSSLVQTGAAPHFQRLR
jgi:hypothetical protein